MNDMPSAFHVHTEGPEVSALIFSSILAFVAAFYTRAWLTLRSTSAYGASARRLLTFLSGLAVTEIAIATPLGTLDHQWLTAHMLKHLLLMQVAAPLIRLGITGFQLWPLLPNSWISHSSLRGARPWSLLANPFRTSVFCWIVGTAAVIGWHIPQIFQIALSSRVWHSLEDVSFVAAGLVFWNPILGDGVNLPGISGWPQVLYLFLATIPCDILSAFLCFSGRVIYPQYAAATGATRVAILQDQNWAGALMWVVVTFAYAIPALVITMRILSANGAKTEAQDSAFFCTCDVLDSAMPRVMRK